MTKQDRLLLPVVKLLFEGSKHLASLPGSIPKVTSFQKVDMVLLITDSLPPRQSSIKGFNSLVDLGAWISGNIISPVKYSDYCVFDGSVSSIPTAVQAFKDEANLWLVGGAKDLAGLGPWRL
jgi:hypothetical protein